MKTYNDILSKFGYEADEEPSQDAASIEQILEKYGYGPAQPETAASAVDTVTDSQPDPAEGGNDPKWLRSLIEFLHGGAEQSMREQDVRDAAQMTIASKILQGKTLNALNLEEGTLGVPLVQNFFPQTKLELGANLEDALRTYDLTEETQAQLKNPYYGGFTETVGSLGTIGKLSRSVSAGVNRLGDILGIGTKLANVGDKATKAGKLIGAGKRVVSAGITGGIIGGTRDTDTDQIKAQIDRDYADYTNQAEMPVSKEEFITTAYKGGDNLLKMYKITPTESTLQNMRNGSIWGAGLQVVGEGFGAIINSSEKMIALKRFKDELAKWAYGDGQYSSLKAAKQDIGKMINNDIKRMGGLGNVNAGKVKKMFEFVQRKTTQQPSPINVTPSNATPQASDVVSQVAPAATASTSNATPTPQIVPPVVSAQAQPTQYTGPERRVDLETRKQVDEGKVTPEQLAELRRQKTFLENRKAKRETAAKKGTESQPKLVELQAEKTEPAKVDPKKVQPGDTIYDDSGRTWKVTKVDQSGFGVKGPQGAETFLGINHARLAKPDIQQQVGHPQVTPEKPSTLTQRKQEGIPESSAPRTLEEKREQAGKTITEKATTNEGEPKVSFRAIRKDDSFIVTEWVNGKKGTTYTIPADEYLKKSNYERSKYIESIHKTQYDGFGEYDAIHGRVNDAFERVISKAGEPKVVVDKAPPGGWKESDKVPDKYKSIPKSDIMEAEGGSHGESGTTEPKQVSDEPVRRHVSGTRTEVSPRSVSGTKSVRDTDEAGVSGAGKGEGSQGGTGGEGIESGSSGRDRSSRSHITKTRKKPSEPINKNNYRITDTDKIGTGTEGERLKNNIEAIRIVKNLMAENRPATNEEQTALVKYVGWGGLPNVFNEKIISGQLAITRGELKQLLTPDEYRAASASTKNAHYTSKEVIDAMWSGVKHLGFTKGYILEPSAGIGHFIGLMPNSVAQGSRVTGIELDTITGNIAKHLYPDSDIRVMGFEEADIGPIYDLAISNVPFGDYAVYDEKIPKPMRGSIHNYFFAKALETVRPGGLVVFITSRYTMDSRVYNKNEFNPRNYMANRANFVGAIRLPNTAFKSNAGTEVVTDIIVLQKKGDGVRESGEQWLDVKKKGDNFYSPFTNEYFHNHPEMILGKEAMTGSMYGGNEYTVESNGEPLGPQIEKAFKSLPKVFKTKVAKNITNPKPVEMIAAPGELKEGSFTIQDGKLYRNRKGSLFEETATANEIARISKQIELVNAIKDNMRIQYSGGTDAELNESQAKLNKAYDSFVKDYGYLHEKKNSGKFADDPEFNRLLAVENWDPKTKKATKSDLFSKRTIQQYSPPTSADNSHEALIYSLNERGIVDPEYMAELTGQTVEKVIEDLGSAVYQNPDNDTWETADAYLSGNVRAKLKIAQNHAKLNPAYKRNVEALKKVIPEDVVPSEIRVRLGANWVAPEVYNEFVKSIFGSGVEISYSAALGEWKVGKGNRYGSLATNEYGTADKDFYELLKLSMNNQKPQVYDHMEANGKDVRVLNQQKTLAAVAKQEKIQKAFEDWIWNDQTRAEKLARIYNDTNNNIVLRSWDGSHMSFPGMNPVWVKQLRPHQKNAIWRGVQGGNALLAHCVGSGKTAEQIGIAMELKRLGIIRKMAWAVPKPLIQQVANDALDIYPGAKILVAGEKSFGKNERREFMNKIATGDWDLIVISHNNLNSIPMSKKALEDFYNERIDALLKAVKEEVELGTRSDRGLVKKLENMIANLQAKLKEETANIKKRQDIGNITWEETGIDGLMVDEAHEYKNLYYHTKMEKVAGLGNQKGVQKTTDLYMKVRHLQRLNGGRGIIFATGTPVANSIAELYHMQRYLQPDVLEERNINTFDSWVNNFAEVTPELEMKPAGDGYRLKDRLSSFVNLPELQQMFRSFADVQTPVMLKLPVPEVATGKPEELAAEPSQALLDYIQTLGVRASELRGKPKKGGDNMLKISGDGRKASLDMRLINPSLPDDPNSKVNLTVEKIVEHYNETANYKGTQAVFLDLSTPGKKGKTLANRQADDDTAEELGLSEMSDDEKALKAQDTVEAVKVYEDIKNKLIAKGIPANEVAFIHDAKTKEARQAMFENVNSGKIRVILGSTAKLGTGANIQERLFAAYNLDAPWKPAEVEQRIGRILRQGNKHMEWNIPIHIYNVVTKKSFDARTWNILNQKQRFIDQLMSPDMTTRQIGDPGGDAVLNFAEVAAIASDNPDILRDIELDNIVAKYRAMKADYERGLREMKIKQSFLPEQIENAKELIGKYEAFVTKRQDTAGDKFSITLGKKTVTKRSEADEYLKKLAKEGFGGKLGNFAGLPIEMIQGESGATVITGDLIRSEASISSLEYRVNKGPESEISRLQGKVRKYEKELDETKKLADKPFEYQKELSESETESREIKQRLLESEKQQQTGDPIEQASAEIEAETAAKLGIDLSSAEATKVATGYFEAVDRVKRAIDVLFGREDNQVYVTDAAVERVLNATKSPLNLKAQIKTAIQGVSRAFRDLFDYEWTVKDYPGFQNDLRLFKGVSRDAQKFALDMSLKILKPLQTPKEFEVFRRLVFLRDLEQGVREAEPDATGVARNIGLTEAQIKTAQKDLRAQVAKTKGSETRIKMALWAHDKVYKAMWEDLKLRGKVSPDAAARKHYVPHRVLDYMNDVDRRFPNLSKRFKTPYRYYLKGRSGSQRLIDTDYIGITLRHFAKLYMDNATDDFNIKIATKFDQNRKLTKAEKVELYGKRKVPVPGKLYEYGGKRYIGWQYDPGRQMFPVEIVTEDTTKKVIAVGRYKKTYLLPVEIADRLTHFKDVELNSHVLNALRKANSLWKQILFSPVTLGIPFQTGNFIGDVINLYASDIPALKNLMKGWKAAKQWQKGRVNKDLEELVHLAEQSRVMESTFMREAGMPYHPKLAQLQPRRYILRKFNPFVAWSDIAEQRELAPRLAKMYADLQRIDSGEMPYSTITDTEALNKNGMSTREIAGKLAREVTVDYHKMNGEAQRILRDLLFPMMAFWHGNFSNWFEYAKRNPGNLAVKFLLPTLIMTMWNWMKFRDTEEKLPTYYRIMPHIITGWKDKDGKPIIIAMQTPVDMAAKIIGLDKTIDIARRIQAGETSWEEGIKELGESVLFAPWDAFKDLLTPFIKAPIEAAMNKSWFTGRTIVPERLQETSRDLPLRIKYIVEQWVAPVGNWSRQQGQNPTESAQKYFTRGPADIPRAVGIRHVDLGREQLNRFYDRLSELEGKYKIYKNALRSGKKTTFSKLGQYRVYRMTATAFSMQNKQIARIRESSLSQDEKDKRINEIRQKMYRRAELLLSRSN